MPTPERTQPDLADVVALARALERDERRTARELRERETQLAPELPAANEDRLSVALAWLDAIERRDPAVRSVHHRAETAFRLTSLGVAFVAALVGWLATLGAFYFDGSGRVNAVAVLAVLVGVPGLLLLPFLLAALPSAITQKLPGATAISALARGLSPGRLGQWLWRMLARETGETMSFVADRVAAHQQLYSGVQKWTLLRWSQWFALCFQLTALAAALILVVFTDLAFGWSTTLTTGDPSLDAQRVHRVTSFLAVPWNWIAPDAQPSLTLIEQSRYFRAASQPLSPSQAAQLGGWWQFIVLTIAVYGVLPRLITLAIAQSRLRAAIRATLLTNPGFSAVVRRLHSARIQTVAIKPDSADPDGESQETPQASTPPPTAGRVSAVINWSAVPIDDAAVSAAFPEAQRLAAGGASSMEQDAALIRQLGSPTNPPSERGDVLILVKGWEPPLLEFIDFVKALRGQLSGDRAEIVVLPVGLGSDSSVGLHAASPAQLKLWRDKLARIGDPSLRVAADRQEVMA
jgi:hypothetical protein